MIAGPRYTGGSPHAVYLRHHDSAIFAGVKCTASSKGGTEHLLCQRDPKDGYEVAIFQDTILVYKAGNPEPIFMAPHK